MKKYHTYLNIILLPLVLLYGCTGPMTRSTPDELSTTEEEVLCKSFFAFNASDAVAGSDMAKVELRIIYEEFLRRGVKPADVAYHCVKDAK